MTLSIREAPRLWGVRKFAIVPVDHGKVLIVKSQEQDEQSWQKPRLVRLGTIREVTQRKTRITQGSGASGQKNS